MKQYLLFIIVSLVACQKPAPYQNSYITIAESLKKYTNLIELTTNSGKSRILIAPKIQGKILTSSYNGILGPSNGWINKEAFTKANISLDKIGGEERIWLGPLGSQYSFYYQNIKPLNENNWKVPEAIGKGSFEVMEANKTSITMKKQYILKNFLETTFSFEVFRKITLLDKNEIEENLAIHLNDPLDYVAYETSHRLINKSKLALKKETGLVSLWSAGMFQGTDETTVIIPLKQQASSNDIYKYMGPLNHSKLKLKDNIILFKTDGKYRSKIGVPKDFSPSVYGSYSQDKKRLTIIQYQQTTGSLYSNSNVTVQSKPYKGEVIPIYNNGTMDYSPTDEASFFELESTSAMQELEPQIDTLKHWHRVYHFSGNKNELNIIASQILNFNLEDCHF